MSMVTPNPISRFNEIYDSTNKATLAFVTAKCGRTDDINDIFQETYMELYKTLVKRGVGYVTNEKALVMRIAKRKVARYYSLSQRLKMFVSMTAANSDGDESDISELGTEAFLTEDFADNYALLETAAQFIASKPEDIQKVFYLTYDIGMSIAEVAQAMSIGESNVKNKLYRTLKELRGLLK